MQRCGRYLPDIPEVPTTWHLERCRARRKPSKLLLRKLEWSVCTSLTQLYLMLYIYIYIYRERERSTTCFGLLQWPSSGWDWKNLVSSYTRFVWLLCNFSCWTTTEARTALNSGEPKLLLYDPSRQRERDTESHQQYRVALNKENPTFVVWKQYCVCLFVCYCFLLSFILHCPQPAPGSVVIPLCPAS